MGTATADTTIAVFFFVKKPPAMADA